MGLSLKGKRVLVTGGAGFIGSHVVDALGDVGAEKIVVVDNLFLGRKENLEDAQKRFGDRLSCYWESARDEGRLGQILESEKIEVVYDMAVIPLPHSLTDPAWNVRENTELTLVLCELARKGAYKTLVHFSSSEAYGTALRTVMDEEHPQLPCTPYAASKLAGDMLAISYAETFGIDTTVLRPFNNYGPRQNDGAHAGIIPLVISRVKAGLPIQIHGDGEQTRDLVFVTDTAQAALDIYGCLETRKRIVNVASGIETSMNTLVRALLESLGVPNHPVVHVEGRPGDVRRHMGGVELAKKLWGYTPKVGLAEGLRRTMAYYANRKVGA